MFDEQPDGDPHGECAAEIHNLRHLLGQCYDEPAVSPAPTFADGMTAEDDRRFLELTNDLTHNMSIIQKGHDLTGVAFSYDDAMLRAGEVLTAYENPTKPAEDC